MEPMRQDFQFGGNTWAAEFWFEHDQSEIVDCGVDGIDGMGNPLEALPEGLHAAIERWWADHCDEYFTEDHKRIYRRFHMPFLRL